MSRFDDWTLTRRRFIGTSLNAFAGIAAVGAGFRFGLPRAVAESIAPVLGQSWTRKHDKAGQPFIPAAPRTDYPQSLEDLVQLCKDPASGNGLHAAGSHWALSTGAVSDFSFIETHDPREDNVFPPIAAAIVKPAMGRTLPEVIPDGLSKNYLDWLNQQSTPHYLIHVEAGKRIYQLYAELDQTVDINDTTTLGGHMAAAYGNRNFAGPWGAATLGGAGGQTVVGAFTTGTHGGDFDRPPIADSVAAIHLVADGGRQFWIEPAPGLIPPLTNDAKLHEKYDAQGSLEIIRNDDFFDAVLVSVGRFGIIYSVIVRAMPQYHLYEQRRLDNWQDINKNIKDTPNRPAPVVTGSWLYSGQPRTPLTGSPGPSAPPPPNPRFLQIVLCLTPNQNFTKNLAGVTQRWELPLPGAEHQVLGRDFRRGDIVNPYDPLIKAPRFANAGRNFTYSGEVASLAGFRVYPEPSLLESACSHNNFMVGLLEEAVIAPLEEFVDSLGEIISEPIRIVLGPLGDLPGVQEFLDFALLGFLVALLREYVRHIAENLGPETLGETLNDLRGMLLEDDDPAARAAGIFIWQVIGNATFKSMQGPRDLEGISYAIMDIHDYRNVSCETNVDSVEVFFDATDDRLIAFCDALLFFEINQEFVGKAAVGYVSLRFMGPSRALLGEQKWPVTCAVEVAVLKDVKGSQELVEFATELGRNPNMLGNLHWGQKNTYNEGDVTRRYAANDLLGRWRRVLATVTNNGANNRFSNAFTRQTGLELLVELI